VKFTAVDHVARRAEFVALEEPRAIRIASTV
jgi:hypothetical protein